MIEALLNLLTSELALKPGPLRSSGILYLLGILVKVGMIYGLVQRAAHCVDCAVESWATRLSRQI